MLSLLVKVCISMSSLLTKFKYMKKLTQKIIYLVTYIRKRWGFDVNESMFMNAALLHKLNINQIESLNQKKILIQMPTDYYYLCLFFVATRFSGNKYACISGLWHQNIMSAPKDESLQTVRRFARRVFNLLDEFKWKKLYKSIGVSRFCTLHVSIWQAFKNRKEAKLIWRSLRTKSDVLALEINGTACGDLIYDTYLRYRVQPTVDIKDPYLKIIISKCLNAQAAFRKQLSKSSYDIFLSSYSSYIQHGIPVREAINAGLDVFTAGNLSQYFKRLDKNDWLHTAAYWKYKSQLNLLGDVSSKRKAAKLQLQSRFNGQIDSATQYMKSSAYESNAHEMPANIEAVVFLHDFFDSPHCYRNMLFEDFWEWAKFTLDVIESEQLNIAIKPHPNQLPESIDVVNQLKMLYPKIVWLDPKISNLTIFQAGIKCGISVYGTILHELAYHKIVALAAGDHPHVAFDIAITPTSIEDYRNYLIDFKNIKLPLNVMDEVLDFYYMHNLYEKEDFLIDFNKINLRVLEQTKSVALKKFTAMQGLS